jgi:hypothetical protein
MSSQREDQPEQNVISGMLERHPPTPFFVRAGEVLRGAVNDSARMAWLWYPAANVRNGQAMTPQAGAVRNEVELMFDLATRLTESIARLECMCRGAWSHRRGGAE